MTKLEIFRDGELYLILRDGIYHIHGTIDGKRIRKSCGTRDLATAKLKLDSLKREYLSGWRSDYDDPDLDWKAVASMVHKRHSSSAIERAIPFELEVSEVYGMMRSTDFRCAVSGIPFSKTMLPGRWRDPWAPSLDRIENRHGYVASNVRVVCLIANTAMNQWGYDALLRLANGVVRSSFIVSAADTICEQAKTKTEENQLVNEV